MFLHNNIVIRKNRTKTIAAAFSIIFASISSFSYTYAVGGVEPQQVKIRFYIDDGNRDGAKVSIEKDGKIWKSNEGLAQQTFMLDYQHEYLFTFSKPGYITKKIAFSTKVPKDMLKDGFDPYFMDVTIFKQYDGVNIVVFTQPVGKIVYQQDIDGFGYDTDYNKIVLSEQKQVEEKIQEIKIAEKKTGVPAKTISPENVDNTKSKNSEGESGKDDVAKQRQGEEVPGRDEPVNRNTSENEVKNNKNIRGVVEGDGKGKLGSQTGTDSKGSIAGATEGEQRNNGNLGSLTEEEKRKRLAASMDANDTKNNGNGNGKITRDEETIDEGNRKITKVTVIQNGQVTVYKKIVYKWGGVFFYEDGINITEADFNREAL